MHLFFSSVLPFILFSVFFIIIYDPFLFFYPWWQIKYIDTLFWLLEDWHMGMAILQTQKNNLPKKIAQKLQLSQKVLQHLISQKYIELEKEKVCAEYVIKVDVECI